MITKLTKEQEAQIPQFIAKWVGMAARPTDREQATKAVQDIYADMKQEKPIVIFGQSPFATAAMAAMFFSLVKDKKSYSQLYSQLDSQLHSQLRSQLSSQLNSQLYSQLDSQLYSQLDSQLHSQLRSQLSSQLNSQLDSQLDSQLGSQLDSQLRSQLDSQLDSQLYSQLDSQLGSQLHSQLRSQLSSQLNSQLYSQLDSQLKEINSDWYLSVWWLVWSGWYEYGQYIGVKFDKEKYDLFMSFVSNVGFIIPYKGIAFVSEAPTNISWRNGVLHNDAGKSIEYGDGWGIYDLAGVTFPEDLWQKVTSGTLTAQELAVIDDVDQRRIAMTYLKGEDFIKQMKAELIDEGHPMFYEHLPNRRIRKHLYLEGMESEKEGIVVTNRLYKIKAGEVYEHDKYFLHYLNPSTGEEHISFVTNYIKKVGKDADALMASKHNTSKAEFLAGLGA
jgi:hypothetical protein